MTARALGFAYKRSGDGEVAISRQGRVVTVLCGRAAHDFLAEVEGAPMGAQQQAMARATGNYKRGNERTAAEHPRNRGRG
jgi:hypothetical protein